jgi:hypothetical protein
MSKPIIKIYDCATGDTTEREMTAAEFAQHKKDIVEAETKQAEISAKAEAKAALLDRLGITEDEAKLLLA